MALRTTKAFAFRMGKFADGCFECLCSDEKLAATMMVGMMIGMAAELRRSRF